MPTLLVSSHCSSSLSFCPHSVYQVQVSVAASPGPIFFHTGSKMQGCGPPKAGWASHSPSFASPDYLCPLFTCCNRFWINKNKSRTNKFPSSVLFISAASSSPRLWEHFSPQVRVPGPAPCPGMLSRLPRVVQSQTIYRAEALEPLSSDGLVCSPGATPLGRGTGSEGVVVGPSEQRGVLFGGPLCL